MYSDVMISPSDLIVLGCMGAVVALLWYVRLLDREKQEILAEMREHVATSRAMSEVFASGVVTGTARYIESETNMDEKEYIRHVGGCIATLTRMHPGMKGYETQISDQFQRQAEE